MATQNLDAPLGLRPVDNGLAGSVPRLEEMYANSVAIYEGDLLQLETNGQVTPCANVVTTSEPLAGVAANYLAAGTAGQGTTRVVSVYTDPFQRYVLQADDDDITATPAAIADFVGLNFDLVYTTGNTTTLQSKHELDASSGATTAGLPLRCIDRWKGIDNIMSAASPSDSAYLKFVVQIVFGKHYFGSGVSI